MYNMISQNTGAYKYIVLVLYFKYEFVLKL